VTQGGPDTELRYLPGVGPRRAELLEKLGLVTAQDMLLYAPRRYEDRREVARISEVETGAKVTCLGRVTDLAARRTRGGRHLVRIAVEDDTGSLECAFFNRPYLANLFRVGQTVVVTGKVKVDRGATRLASPEFEIVAEEDDDPADGPQLSWGRMVPVYGLTEGVTQRTMRFLAWTVLERFVDSVPEVFDDAFRRERELLSIAPAIRALHFPDAPEDALRAHRRLAYEELFVFALGLTLARKRADEAARARAFKISPEVEKRIAKRLPFALTGAQERCVAEVFADLRAKRPMRRLLQGDVGSGKTAVAAAAMLAVVAERSQCAVMVPTEILAEQHFATLSQMLEGSRVRLARLTGGVRGRTRDDLLARCEAGEVDILVGTHAVIEKDVAFRTLGLVVVDEGHKFGVRQRLRLREKGRGGVGGEDADTEPHVLVLTATPIPRTLALAFYGDLDVSTIDEMPKGRPEVVTRGATERGRARVYDSLRRELRKGRQAYIVYPLVEESADSDLAAATSAAERLAKGEMRGFRVGLLHGRMKPAEKTAAMREFAAGKVQVLVSTIVVEVGLDVANATVMIVEHAERFGLAQLHQMRGRIGRGAHKSWCILFANPKTDEAKRRLRTVIRTRDGFRLAEEDFRLRGPGEFFGTRQHGLAELRFADLLADAELVNLARADAARLVAEDSKLAAPEHKALACRVRRVFAGRLELADVG